MTILRLARTLRHLRWTQFSSRVMFAVCRPTPKVGPPPPVRIVRGEWLKPPRHAPSLHAGGVIRHLHEQYPVLLAEDWDRTEVAKLWRYHLHYHHFVLSSTDDGLGEAQCRLVDRWIVENPPGVGSGWEPYPVSRRILAWIDRALTVGDLSDAAIASLAIQVRWLRSRVEHHLQGNHLLVNAAALTAAGLFFTGSEGDGWLREGVSLLGEQMAEQVLDDGGHYERSVMYHAQLFEDLLRVVAIHRAYAIPAPEAVTGRLSAMASWLARFRHPDRAIVLFNDAAEDGCLDPDALLAYAKALGFSVEEPPDGDGLMHAVDTGYVRARRGEAVLFVDLAPLGPDHQPGHGHADSLSCEWSLGRQRLLVDSGTSVYGLGAERLRQRGSAAHNTVVVDGEDSSEVWAGFRVGRRAKVQDVVCRTVDEVDQISGAHDGYRHLRGVGVHRRTYQLAANALRIADEVQGSGWHRIEVPFHLHPQISAVMDGDTDARISLPDRVVTVALDPALKWSVEPATWHPQFGVTLTSQKLVGQGDVELPRSWAVRFSW